MENVCRANIFVCVVLHEHIPPNESDCNIQHLETTSDFQKKIKEKKTTSEEQ